MSAYTLDAWESLDHQPGLRVELYQGLLVVNALACRTDHADGPTIYCYQLDGDTYSVAMTLSAGTVGTAAVTGTVSVTFDPADLRKRR